MPSLPSCMREGGGCAFVIIPSLTVVSHALLKKLPGLVWRTDPLPCAGRRQDGADFVARLGVGRSRSIRSQAAPALHLIEAAFQVEQCGGLPGQAGEISVV